MMINYIDVYTKISIYILYADRLTRDLWICGAIIVIEKKIQTHTCHCHTQNKSHTHISISPTKEHKKNNSL